jgi:hypothetical protein
MSTGCDMTTAVAMPRGKFPLNKLVLGDVRRDPRDDAASHGAYSWQNGQLTLLLSVKGKGSVTVTDVKPHVRSSQKKKSYDWVLQKTDGCGGPNLPAYTRFDLDTSAFETVEAGRAGVVLGRNVTPLQGQKVTRQQPQRASFVVHSCHASYTWSLEVRYRLSGQDKTQVKVLGPFRSAGGIPGIPVHDLKPSENGQGHVLVDTGKKTSAGCRPVD